MTTGTLHTTWLSLIDRSGPFLSVQVLESALPQGLEAVQTKFKQKLRLAYEEWRDAVDNEDPLLEELHKEWIRLVLWDILEYDNASLIPNTSEEVKYTNEESMSIYAPTFVVKSPVSNKVRFFIDVLPPEADLEKPLVGDKWPISVIEKMTLLCRSQKVRYGLVTNGEKWTIVSAPVGATSGTATFYSRLWRYEPVTLKAFQTLLGVRRCFGSEEATLDTLLDSSLSSYEEVTNTLGEQVRRAVEVLIQSLDSADQDRNRELLDGISPSELYDASVTVMMRLVFLLCAEERELLLLGDPIYDQFYAVTTLRSQLAEEAGRLGPEVLERRHDAWSRLLATFRAVYGGIEHETLRLPPLGGSLFDPDKYPFLEGRKIGSSWRDSEAVPLPIDNRTVLLLLTALQILEQKGGALHLSYRALDVEQIGHVYEGLLDNTVTKLTETTLSLEGKKEEKIFISLSEIQSKKASGNDALIDFLSEKLEKNKTSIGKQLGVKISESDHGRLLLACGGNEKLANDVSPYYYLLGTDIWGYPLVYKSNSYAVSSGSSRKETGTHYTPRTLTEKIVTKAIESLVYLGPEIGLDRKEWKLKSSQEILSLKVCDPAMGSAAFLVQVCRTLSEYLVLAWNNEGKVPSTANLHDRLLSARKLVAEKCLYGVDLNPLAVELAKLSLWLITMSKGKPFEFLDHNFKCGDSLFGIVHQDELYSFSVGSSSSNLQGDLLSNYSLNILTDVLSIRDQIRNIEAHDIKDIALAASLNNQAQNSLEVLRLIADSICASVDDEKRKSIFKGYIENIISGQNEYVEKLRNLVKENLIFDTGNTKFHKKPLHWLLEFPEVFIKNSGFDLIIGNPPFLGGRKIRSKLSLKYLNYLTKYLVPGASANSDLCSFFLVRANSLCRLRGVAGFILSSSVAEGDTRETGLQRILSSGTVIVRGYSRFPWPGVASVTISIVEMYKGTWTGEIFLNDEKVTEINSYLSQGSTLNITPFKLSKNKDLTFQGSIPYGMGFVIDDDLVERIVKSNPKYENVIYRYLVGQELNIDPKHTPSKWIINFHDWPLSRENNYNGPVAEDYPECLNIIKEKVYPERTRKKENGEFALRKPLPQKWWQYSDKRPELYRRLSNLKFAFAIATMANKYIAFGRVSGRTVYSNSISILATDDYGIAGLLSSNLHEIWARKYGGYNLQLIRYAPTDLLETYPLPIISEELRVSGKDYFDTRESLGLGITEIYNKVHDSDVNEDGITNFRNKIVLLDQQVLLSYGWGDISLEHNFYETQQGIRFTISDKARAEILNRTLKLNHERFLDEENVSSKKPNSKSTGKKAKDIQETDHGENK